MTADALDAPRLVPQVAISSTFEDLQAHRAALIKCLRQHGLAVRAMEDGEAKLVDVVESSLEMVRDSSAYIGVIGRRYGQTPDCPRNPEQLSITELEFDEALRLKRPILLFIMGDEYLVPTRGFESDPVKLKKLNDFRERAKRISPDSAVHRVYAEFNSLDEFEDMVGRSVAGLRRHLDEVLSGQMHPHDAPIPNPPALYAEPHYIVANKFIGRQAELRELSDWALPSDPHTMLLLEAIGGNGKSMLTWAWANGYAPGVRSDWAGRFWYSFYADGADMADFCRHALAYMTRQSREELRTKKRRELAKQLLSELHARPWLLILDGLERALVSHHRIDAGAVADNELDNPTDKIVNRDPYSAIHTEDDDLLHYLAAAAPSKVLVSSRLVPRVLLNAANQPILGVRCISLRGLLPPDAEALLRSHRIDGSSEQIQRYLAASCDCHPLVIGAIAGLINSYLPDRGNFDAWIAAPDGGGRLNLADLDLRERSSHILSAAFAAAPEKGKQLLFTLALLPESADYSLLSALNPHLPPEPEEVEEPENPAESPEWSKMWAWTKAKLRKQYQSALARRKEYESAVRARLESAEFAAAAKELERTVLDLERRGLLQYDRDARRYDIHPVVRAVAVAWQPEKSKKQYGERVVEYFLKHAGSPYAGAETVEEVSNGLNLVRALVKLGRYGQAAGIYKRKLNRALVFNLEACADVVSLLRPFFDANWNAISTDVGDEDRAFLLTAIDRSLNRLGEFPGALEVQEVSLKLDLREGKSWAIQIDLIEINEILVQQNKLSAAARCNLLALGEGRIDGDEDCLFRERLDRFEHLARIGSWDEAKAQWQAVKDTKARLWRNVNRSRLADNVLAWALFWQGALDDEQLRVAEGAAAASKNHSAIRELHRLRGIWRLEQEEWSLAGESLQEAVRMARERGIYDADAESGLALAKFHLGQLGAARHEAEQLGGARKVAHRFVAMLWLAIGDRDQAEKHALAAYAWACADGEPFVHRYELTKTIELLQRLGMAVRPPPRYDHAKDAKFAWEDDVAAFSERAKHERQEADE
jgi:hypothetical protein